MSDAWVLGAGCGGGACGDAGGVSNTSRSKYQSINRTYHESLENLMIFGFFWATNMAFRFSFLPYFVASKLLQMQRLQDFVLRGLWGCHHWQG